MLGYQALFAALGMGRQLLYQPLRLLYHTCCCSVSVRCVSARLLHGRERDLQELFPKVPLAAAPAVPCPRFPLESSALAPGICAEVDVCFTPDSLGDYEDAFSVESPAGGFEVQLTGMRPHPKLSLAPVLEVRDACACGTSARIEAEPGCCHARRVAGAGVACRRRPAHTCLFCEVRGL